MQRSQGVCELASLKSMLAGALLLLLVLGCATMAPAQVNTATLSGTVSDPQGLPVKGAKVTLTNAGTGAQRTSVTDDSGRYNLVGLPPGLSMAAPALRPTRILPLFSPSAKRRS